MMRLLFIIFISISCVLAQETLPNFLSGLDRETTFEFYNIESSNLTKAEIIAKKQAWAAKLPPRNKELYDQYMTLVNKTKQDLVTSRNNQKANWSTDAEDVENKIQQILNNYTLTREEEATAIDAIFSNTPVEIQHELSIQEPDQRPPKPNIQQVPVHPNSEPLTQPVRILKEQDDTALTGERVSSISELFRKIDSVKSQTLFQG